MQHKINFAYKMLTNTQQKVRVAAIVPASRNTDILAQVIVSDDHYTPPLFWRVVNVSGGDYLSLTMTISMTELELLMK